MLFFIYLYVMFVHHKISNYINIQLLNHINIVLNK